MMREKVQRSHLALAKGKWARQCALLRAIKQVSRKTRPIELAACGCVGSPSSFGRSKTGRGLRRLHFLAEKALIFKHICILGSRSVICIGGSILRAKSFFLPHARAPHEQSASARCRCAATLACQPVRVNCGGLDDMVPSLVPGGRIIARFFPACRPRLCASGH